MSYIHPSPITIIDHHTALTSILQATIFINDCYFAGSTTVLYHIQSLWGECLRYDHKLSVCCVELTVGDKV